MILLQRESRSSPGFLTKGPPASRGALFRLRRLARGARRFTSALPASSVQETGDPGGGRRRSVPPDARVTRGLQVDVLQQGSGKDRGADKYKCCDARLASCSAGQAPYHVVSDGPPERDVDQRGGPSVHSEQPGLPRMAIYAEIVGTVARDPYSEEQCPGHRGTDAREQQGAPTVEAPQAVLRSSGSFSGRARWFAAIRRGLRS